MAENTATNDGTTSGIDASLSSTADGNTTGNGSGGGGSFEFIESDGEPSKKRRGRRTKEQIAQDNANGTKSTSKSTSKREKVNGQKAADFLINKLETISARVLDKDTSLNVDEHLFIDEPLAALLANMDMSAVDKYSKIINPILVLFGLMLWYIRIAPKQPVRINQKVDNNAINSNPVSTTETTFTPTSPKDNIAGNYEGAFNL